MKINILFAIFLAFSFSSCTSFPFLTEKMTIGQLLAEKEKIDNSKNPAEVLLLKNALSEKKLILENLIVKDIVTSTNVDYDFCVLADIETNKGKIECQIYTINIRTISKLKRGESLISVKGNFNRYFTALDDYYTKIEITNSTILIINKDDSKTKN